MPTLFAPMENLISPAKGHLDRPYLDRPGKAATVLAWVSGMLAVPTGVVAVVGFFGIFPPLLFAIGAELLVGYVMEARGNGRKPSFWIRSIVFNSLLLAVTLGATIAYLAASSTDSMNRYFSFILAAWQATAIHLSYRALKNPNHQQMGIAPSRETLTSGMRTSGRASGRSSDEVDAP